MRGVFCVLLSTSSRFSCHHQIHHIFLHLSLSLKFTPTSRGHIKSFWRSICTIEVHKSRRGKVAPSEKANGSPSRWHRVLQCIKGHWVMFSGVWPPSGGGIFLWRTTMTPLTPRPSSATLSSSINTLTAVFWAMHRETHQDCRDQEKKLSGSSLIDPTWNEDSPINDNKSQTQGELLKWLWRRSVRAGVLNSLSCNNVKKIYICTFIFYPKHINYAEPESSEASVHF